MIDATPQGEVVAFKCHLCGKVKEAATEWRALYVLAFHYDRRHKGWTHEEPRASVAGEAHTPHGERS